MKHRILITGAAGFLGWHLTRRLEDEMRAAPGEIEVWASFHKQIAVFGQARVCTMDLTSAEQCAECLEHLRPNVILHVAALTDTGVCEKDPGEANRANIEATANLLRAAENLSRKALAPPCENKNAEGRSGIKKSVTTMPYIVYVSTDLVFDGERAPYREEDATGPVMHYGRTKEAAEQLVRKYAGEWTILRPALMYGAAAPARGPFIEWIVKPLREGRESTLFTDEWRTPVWVGDVAEALTRLALGPQRPGAILHCGGADRLSRLEMGQAIARRWNLPAEKLRPALRAAVKLACPRPRDVSLVSDSLVAELGFQPLGFEEGLKKIE